MLDKTLKSTKFWAAVGTTVATIGAVAVKAVDVPTAVQTIGGVWAAFIVGRGLEDAAVKGAKEKAKN